MKTVFAPILFALFILLILQMRAAGPCHAQEVYIREPLPSPDEIAELPPDGGPEFNRLIHEKSPYLLQHARNPVDWYPWGDEAFAAARAKNLPIFLSVGYSTCHWCHVMERECFEHADVAELLNKYFVAIKVDREERPDIDGIYMNATQLVAGRGGWPNSVWLTPDGNPWFAGTYFPREDSAGRPGFKTMLRRLSELWNTRRMTLKPMPAYWPPESNRFLPGRKSRAPANSRGSSSPPVSTCCAPRSTRATAASAARPSFLHMESSA